MVRRSRPRDPILRIGLPGLTHHRDIVSSECSTDNRRSDAGRLAGVQRQKVVGDKITWVASVFAVAGFLGTGKTTFSRELARSTGGVRLSIDEWTIGLSGDDFALDPELFSRTWNLLSELWPRIAWAGVDVILDFGFWRREDRDVARARATEARANFRLYWLQCSEETSRTRVIGRREAGSYRFDSASFDLLRTRFEPLTDDEIFEVVTT